MAPPCEVNLEACRAPPPRAGKIIQLLAKYEIFCFSPNEFFITYAPLSVEVEFDVSGLSVGKQTRGIGRTEVIAGLAIETPPLATNASATVCYSPASLSYKFPDSTRLSPLSNMRSLDYLYLD